MIKLDWTRINMSDSFVISKISNKKIYIEMATSTSVTDIGDKLC